MSQVTNRLEILENIRSAKPAILPSMLLCDFANLEAELAKLEQANIPALHLDVMDGIFVPNFTYGMTIVEAFNRATELPLDVHLMIARPLDYIDAFVKAGADVITFHVEAEDNPAEVLEKIRSHNIAGGIAFNASTPVEKVLEYLPLCDLVLVMSIEAGFGGQKFQPEVLEKFQRIRDAADHDVVLEIDGGVNRETIQSCVEAGAELLVAGSAIFRQDDYTTAVEAMLEQVSA